MNHVDTLLLLALPASGKSEIRRYVAHVDPEVAARDFHLGPTVQLDDYPYVQLMLLIDHQIVEAGGPPVFFESATGLLIEPRDWGMLTRLLAEDYAALGTKAAMPGHPTAHLLDRFDRARAHVGVTPVADAIPASLLPRVADALDAEIGLYFRSLREELGRYDDSSTVVVEFARGGPEGAACPLPEPHGYSYTLPHLGAAMLRRASILYVSVTPEDSRRRNRERAGPGPQEEASVLHHRVPDVVMHQSYGTDDLPWLIERGHGSVVVEAGGDSYHLAAEVFDNRRDYTSFLRRDPATWPEESITGIHDRLRDAFNRLGEPAG